MVQRIKRQWILTVALVLALGAVAVSGGLAENPDDDNVYESLAIFSDVLNKLRSEYVEEVKTSDLIDAGIEGMLSVLDPYTQYLDPDQYKYLMQGTHGSFGGLGIEIAIRDGVLTVVSPLEGTPAYRMGIQGGDRIIKIDGESTKGITSNEAVKRLRGPQGSPVTITIHREGVDKPLDYTITRDIIRIESVPYSFMLDSGVGYIRVSQFSEDTADEIDRRLTELEAQNPRGYVIDLRFNPGGLLSQAVAVSDLFLERGDLIVSTRGRHRSQNKEYMARNDAVHDKGPFIVLVNGGSASASEIVAGAFQDWDRGLIVGTRTFGKGSVQSVVPLRHGGGALKITTAKYFTPSGRCIHRDEEEPEALAQMDPDVEAYFDEEEEEGGMELHPPSEKPEEAPSFRTYHGRVVHGGGGIQPDVIIEASPRSEVAQELERKTVFFNFVIRWLSNHPDVQGVPTPEETPIDEFLTYAKGEAEVELTDEQIAENKEYMVRALRREIALKTLGHEAMVRVAIEGDTQLQEAVRLFDTAGTLAGLFEAAEQRSPKGDELAGEGAPGDRKLATP